MYQNIFFSVSEIFKTDNSVLYAMMELPVTQLLVNHKFFITW